MSISPGLPRAHSGTTLVGDLSVCRTRGRRDHCGGNHRDFAARPASRLQRESRDAQRLGSAARACAHPLWSEMSGRLIGKGAVALHMTDLDSVFQIEARTSLFLRFHMLRM